MKTPGFALFLIVSCAATLLAQKGAAPAAASGPLMADVHASPYRSAMYDKLNISDQRFDLRDATILNLIALAYDKEDEAIVGGPSWIDFDRFDVIALVPSLKAADPNAGGPMDAAKPQANPVDEIRPLLKRVLADRFHLTYHAEERPLPGYVITPARGGAKLTDAKDPAADPNCQVTQPDKAVPEQDVLTCTSETVAKFFANFRLFPHPAVDHTGLTKPYDFTLKIDFSQVHSQQEETRLFIDVLDRQLGLTVTPGDVPQPALVVDKVERPTPNPPEIAKLIPALPDLEFEVASIRPTAEGEPTGQVRPAGSQITFSGYSLQELLVMAWQLPTGAMLGNAPPWINGKKYTILVKLPPGMDGRLVYQNQDQLDNMLQKLLVDRFQIKYHWGEQTQDGYVLYADTPRMKPADPNTRSWCRYGPPEGEKDMHPSGSAYDNQSHCQNVTMDQFADMLQNLAKSEIKNHVQNKTGLDGSYDLTFYYTSARKLRADAAAAVAAARASGTDNGAASSDPNDGMGIVDAFKKELGLKLVKQAGTYPALVLDQIEQTPTEN